MNWDDLKDQLQQAFERLQESNTFLTLKERYETLSRQGQLVANLSTALIIGFVLLWIPWGCVSNSLEWEDQFVEHRDFMRKIIKRPEEQLGASFLPETYDSDELIASLKSSIERSGFLEEQIIGVTNWELSAADTSYVKSPVVSVGAKVQLERLNVTEIEKLSGSIQNLGKNIFIANMNLQESAVKANYFNLEMYILAFSLPTTNSSARDTTSSNRRRSSFRNTQDDEE